MRWKVGHSRWLGAGQAAAWRRPSRMAVSLRMVRSRSSALAASISRSMRGWPSAVNIRAISSSVKPAAWPNEISASRSRIRRVEQAVQAAPPGGLDESPFLVIAQRRGGQARTLRYFRDVQVSHPLTSSRLEVELYLPAHGCTDEERWMGPVDERDGGQAAVWNGAGGRGWADQQEVMDGILQPLEDVLVEAVGAGAGDGFSTSAAAPAAPRWPSPDASAQEVPAPGSTSLNRWSRRQGPAPSGRASGFASFGPTRSGTASSRQAST